MKYCSDCGNPVIKKVPSGDNRNRFVCLGCGIIHYSNPNIITGCLVTHKDKVLLCQRALSPGIGLWTFPAGFMENNETAAEGAIRETLEESQATVVVDDLYALYDVPHMSQLYIFYRASLLDYNFGPGPETLAADLFSESEIPWRELAFPIIKDTLELYFQDRVNNSFPIRSQTCHDIVEGD